MTINPLRSLLTYNFLRSLNGNLLNMYLLKPELCVRVRHMTELREGEERRGAVSPPPLILITVIYGESVFTDIIYILFYLLVRFSDYGGGQLQQPYYLCTWRGRICITAVVAVTLLLLLLLLLFALFGGFNFFNLLLKFCAHFDQAKALFKQAATASIITTTAAVAVAPSHGRVHCAGS